MLEPHTPTYAQCIYILVVIFLGNPSVNLLTLHKGIVYLMQLTGKNDFCGAYYVPRPLYSQGHNRNLHNQPQTIEYWKLLLPNDHA